MIRGFGLRSIFCWRQSLPVSSPRFYALAERSRIEFGKLELSVEGNLGTFEGRLSFLQIVVQPTGTVFQTEDRERAYGLLERTEHGCLIARTLKCQVLMEPLVRTADEVLTR